MAAETTYVVKASSPDGSVVDTSGVFKVTMLEQCLTAISVDQDNLTDMTYFIDTAALTPVV